MTDDNITLQLIKHDEADWWTRLRTRIENQDQPTTEGEQNHG